MRKKNITVRISYISMSQNENRKYKFIFLPFNNHTKSFEKLLQLATPNIWNKTSIKLNRHVTDYWTLVKMN